MKNSETTTKPKQKNESASQEAPSDSDRAQGRPFASSPLVVTLLVVLLGAVLVEGALLLGVYSKTKTDHEAHAADKQQTEAPALVPKLADQNKTPSKAQAPGPAPGSSFPLQPVPFGSPFDDDFFSDDWQPFAEMARMRERMDRLFEDSFKRFRSMPGFDEDWLNLGSAFHSNAAIREEDGKFIVTMDLPGADESSLDIKLENNVLSVSGKREEINEEKDAKGNVIRKSSSTSSFQNAFSLPAETDPSGLKSDYKEGVLTITIPKAKK